MKIKKILKLNWLIKKLKAINLNLRRVFSTKGLVITLFIGIFINLSSNKINEIIQRQRYLEMLQYEITGHALQGASLVEDYVEDSKIKISAPYSDYIYKAGLENGFLLSINPDVWGNIGSYYEVRVNYTNMIENTNREMLKEFEAKWHRCIFEANTEGDFAKCEKYNTDYENAKEFYSEMTFSSTKKLTQEAFALLKIFSPTQKRLNSLILKLLMGNKTLEVMR